VSKYSLNSVKSCAMKRYNGSDNKAARMQVAQGRQLSRQAGVELKQLKARLLFEHKRVVGDRYICSWFDRAAQEAESLAWATPYPTLVLPVLLEEKLREAEHRARLQRAIYERTQAIVTLAA